MSVIPERAEDVESGHLDIIANYLDAIERKVRSARGSKKHPDMLREYLLQIRECTDKAMDSAVLATSIQALRLGVWTLDQKTEDGGA